MNLRPRIVLIVSALSLGSLAGTGPGPSAGLPAAGSWVWISCAVAAAPAKRAAIETGIASVYSDRLQGRKTASGETYDPERMTAAHKTLPFGTQVKVTNARTHRNAVVTINDRGPAHAGRVLDLSPRAAKALGIDPTGVAKVTVEVVAEAPEKSSPK